MIIAGGGIFVWWLVMSDLTATNVLRALLLGGLAALVGVLFLREAKRQQRLKSDGWTSPRQKWYRRNLQYLLAIGLPLVVTIAVSIHWAPILLSRVDDGDRGARLIEGNGVSDRDC